MFFRGLSDGSYVISKSLGAVAEDLRRYERRDPKRYNSPYLPLYIVLLSPQVPFQATRGGQVTGGTHWNHRGGTHRLSSSRSTYWQRARDIPDPPCCPNL